MRRQVPLRAGPPDTTRPGSVEADTVAHCGDSTAGDYVNSLTFTELFSGWTENRAVWNKSGQAIRQALQELESSVPFVMKDFHTDKGSELLNWALHEHLTCRPVKLPWTRSRAYRKNDNAHCEQKNWTHVRQLFGHERFGHAEVVPLMNDLYTQVGGVLHVILNPGRDLRRDESGHAIVFCGSFTMRRWRVFAMLPSSVMVPSVRPTRPRVSRAIYSPPGKTPLKLAENSRSRTQRKPDWFADLGNQFMEQRFKLFRRAGVYYYEHTPTGKQTSLRTKDESEALTLLHSRNEALRQPVLNLQIARTS